MRNVASRNPQLPTVSKPQGFETNMPILVTGATGLLGNNVVRILVEHGVPTRVLLRPGHDKRCLADLDVEQVTRDICNSDEVRAACQACAMCVISPVGSSWQRARRVLVDAKF